MYTIDTVHVHVMYNKDVQCMLMNWWIDVQYMYMYLMQICACTVNSFCTILNFKWIHTWMHWYTCRMTFTNNDREISYFSHKYCCQQKEKYTASSIHEHSKQHNEMTTLYMYMYDSEHHASLPWFVLGDATWNIPRSVCNIIIIYIKQEFSSNGPYQPTVYSFKTFPVK